MKIDLEVLMSVGHIITTSASDSECVSVWVQSDKRETDTDTKLDNEKDVLSQCSRQSSSCTQGFQLLPAGWLLLTVPPSKVVKLGYSDWNFSILAEHQATDQATALNSTLFMHCKQPPGKLV